MAVQYLTLREQSFSIKNELMEAINRVIFKNSSFILGLEAEAFEKEFSNHCGAKYGVGVGNGTSAIYLSLLATGVKPGDEVITVPNTAIPTISAISAVYAKPVLADVDETYQMDFNQIEDKITSKTHELYQELIRE